MKDHLYLNWADFTYNLSMIMMEEKVYTIWSSWWTKLLTLSLLAKKTWQLSKNVWGAVIPFVIVKHHVENVLQSFIKRTAAMKICLILGTIVIFIQSWRFTYLNIWGQSEQNVLRFPYTATITNQRSLAAWAVQCIFTNCSGNFHISQ